MLETGTVVARCPRPWCSISYLQPAVSRNPDLESTLPTMGYSSDCADGVDRFNFDNQTDLVSQELSCSSALCDTKCSSFRLLTQAMGDGLRSSAYKAAG